MSTRANIIFKINDDEYKLFYCHYDGYLSGLGKDLLNGLDDLQDLTDNENSPYEFEGLFEYFSDILKGVHGDIEFLYLVDVENKTVKYVENHQFPWKDYDLLTIDSFKELT